MIGKRMNLIAASLVVLGTLGVPAVGSAQSYRYRDDYRPASARCYYTHRSVARHSYYYEREHVHRRSAAKSALMIAGSAATGAGVGGAIRGKRGALIGAAIGGGAASIFEAAKRR